MSIKLKTVDEILNYLIEMAMIGVCDENKQKISNDIKEEFLMNLFDKWYKEKLN